jgi:hypothetical protein
MRIHHLSLSLLTIILSCYASASSFPPEVELVREYILEYDYPEVFNGTTHQVQIENVLIADINNDGSQDAIVLFQPRFRQSPPIVFYAFDEDGNVSRLMEGLAPGPLRPVTGDLMDSHTIQRGVDVAVDGGGVTDSIIDTALSNANFTGIVAYNTFLHLDMREGETVYIDMTHAEIPDEEQDCANFEFSHVLDVAAGTIAGSDGNYFAAWVDGQIYVYRIEKFRPDGRIDKALWVLPEPEGFSGFVRGARLAYRGSDGEVEPLKIEYLDGET